MRGWREERQTMVAMIRGEGEQVKRHEPPPSNEGSQNIGSGFDGPQAACKPPTTPLGAMRSIDYATTPSGH